ITFLIVVVAAYITADKFETFIYISIIAAGLIFQSFEVIDFYYQATVQAKYITVRRIIQLIISSSLKIYFILVKADLVWFVLVSLFDAVSLAVFSWWIYKFQNSSSFLGYFNRDTAKILLKDSWPLLLSSLALAVYMRIDQIIIKNLLGDREVGLYSVVKTLTEVWYFIPMVITQSVFPAIVNAKKVSEEEYYRRLRKLFSLLIWLSIFISLIFSIFSQNIVDILFGRRYAEAGNLLKFYIWTIVFIYIGFATFQWLLAENLQKFSFYRALTGAIVSFTLNLIFIPKMGISGAVLSAILSYSIVSYFSLLFSRKTIRLFKIVNYSFFLRKNYKLN
ncbi:MAG: flippase, partial [Nanopusillaceae archaeon]